MISGTKLWITAFLIHLLLLWAVLDIFFSSPIEHGMNPIQTTTRPPAKRVVVIVADGVYADAVFYELSLPFLTSIRKNRGSWGVSHTRVPTESRPGHVAILAGIYEDPSAIFKGWQVNPVPFDSVINQATNAWCWGSPDIIPMFNKEYKSSIRMYTYDKSFVDFGKQDTTILDSWVFDEIRRFIQEKQCYIYYDVCNEGNLFFLHLLGSDVAGHAYKPYSKEYKSNIQFIDRKLMEVEVLFKILFKDDKTAYIFTSDHGMTDWGSHGSGSNRETQTPFIAWGAGIVPENKQKDINQTDIAVLIASLIGINIPVNSLGRLPSDYLDVSHLVYYDMILANVLQLKEILLIKEERIMKTALNFKYYNVDGRKFIREKLYLLEMLKQKTNIDRYTHEAYALMDIILDGINYYQNYYQTQLINALTFGIIGWITYLGLSDNYTLRIYCVKADEKLIINFICSLIYFVAAYILFIQRVPYIYYLYFFFSIFTFQISCLEYKIILYNFKMLTTFITHGNGLGVVLIFIIGTQLLAKSFHYRILFGVVLFGLLFWSFKLQPNTIKVNDIQYFALFSAIISFFTLLPEMNTQFSLILYLIGIFAIFATIYKTLEDFQYWKTQFHIDYYQKTFLCVNIQCVFTVITSIYVLCIHENIISSHFKPLAFILLVTPMILLFFTDTNMLRRFNSILLTLENAYILFAFHYDLIFLWLYINTGIFWMNLFLLGFFGTGNIASLNSFDPMWVKCFFTLYNPFKMSIMIIIKLTIPMVLMLIILKLIVNLCELHIQRVFRIILIISEIMMLYFLYNIQNVGSWLEIGISFSNFVIMNAFILILIMLYGISNILTEFSLYDL